MDPITLLVVTVVANALVTGVIVYTIQKSIESSYTKKIDDHRAVLQLNNFEQQTKFSNIYAKRLETLESVYRKYLSFADSLAKLISEIEVAPEFRSVSYEEMTTKFHDVRDYFVENTIFLSDNAQHIIFKTIYESGNLQAVVGLISANKDRLKGIPESWLNILGDLELIKHFADQDLMKTETVLKLIQSQLNMNVEELRNLYREEASNSSSL
jgi:hypothetical protein